LFLRVSGQTDDGECLKQSLELNRRLPDVLQVSNLVGFGYVRLERWEEAYRHLKPGALADVMDTRNFWFLALAARHTGHLDEARRYFLKSRACYLDLGTLDMLLPP
jgi:hypothetical protein